MQGTFVFVGGKRNIDIKENPPFLMHNHYIQNKNTLSQNKKSDTHF